MKSSLGNPTFKAAQVLMHEDPVFLDLIFQLYLLEAAGAGISYSSLADKKGNLAARKLGAYLDSDDGEIAMYLSYNIVEIYEYFSTTQSPNLSGARKNAWKLLFQIFITHKRLPTRDEFRLIHPALIHFLGASVMPLFAFLAGANTVEAAFLQEHKVYAFSVALLWLWVARQNASIFRNPRYHAEWELRRIVRSNKLPRSVFHFLVMAELAMAVFRTHIAYVLGVMAVFVLSWWEIAIAVAMVANIVFDFAALFVADKRRGRDTSS